MKNRVVIALLPLLAPFFLAVSPSSHERVKIMAMDIENYEVAPGLELEQVHVYVRHGERTPVGIRLHDPPASIPQHWFLCKAARQFNAAVLGLSRKRDHFEVTSQRVQRAVERRDGTSVDSECLLGELTDLGRQSTYQLGLALRKLYVDRLGFLPDTIVQNGTTYFRSTNIPRTIESLQEIIHGLYPDSKFRNGVVPRILLRNSKDENLFANTFACRRLEILNVRFAQAAAEALNESLKPLDKILSKYIGGNPIRIDGKPRVSGILDTIRAAKAHGIPVPQEFEDQTIVDKLEYAVVTEWFGDASEEFRRLAMGRLLGELQAKLQKKVDHGPEDPLKILIHSTHDTALAGLCATLGVFDYRWPDFAASITFELFRREAIDSSGAPIANPNSAPRFQSFLSSMYGLKSPFQAGNNTPTSIHDYYIRMRYQNKSLVLPHCATPGKHLEGAPEYCTLVAFQERVKELTPTDWEAECSPAGKGVKK